MHITCQFTFYDDKELVTEKGADGEAVREGVGSLGNEIPSERNHEPCGESFPKSEPRHSRQMINARDLVSVVEDAMYDYAQIGTLWKVSTIQPRSSARS